jgi:YD repeat-containing protein
VNGWKLYEHRITGQTQATISGSEIIDELRMFTLGAQMTSFTVQTGIGVTSETSPEGRVTFYEYDAFGRLWLIRNNEKQITKKICYNYFGQPESCQADANPVWAPNGKIGCDVCPNSPTNTTNVQVHQEVDVNPNSPTYGATRWVSDGIPGKCKSTCP